MKGSDKLWSGVLILIFILEILSVYNHWDYIISNPVLGIDIFFISIIQFVVLLILAFSCIEGDDLRESLIFYIEEASLPKQLFPFVFLWGAAIPILIIILLVVFIKKLNKWADDKL